MGAESSKCANAELCKQAVVKMGIDGYLDHSQDYCYCEECCRKRGDHASYERGLPPELYALPVGWCRCALSVTSADKFANWHRTYHGTEVDTIVKIIRSGGLVPAGSVNPLGEMIRVRPGHIGDDIPDPEHANRIFLTPSIIYAGDECYATAKPKSMKIDGKNYHIKVALQVLLKPDTYTKEKQTFFNGSRPRIDPLFSNSELEWVTNRSENTQIYGLLIKLEKIHAPMRTQVMAS